MKTTTSTIYLKSILSTLILLMSVMSSFAGGNSETKTNLLSYDLGNTKVNIEFENQSYLLNEHSSTELHQAVFDFNKNMMLNNTHLKKGKYEVRLSESYEGLSLVFMSKEKNESDVSILLTSKVGEKSDYINYSLELIEDDKLRGEINYEGMEYIFTMEVALSNTIFSYLNKEELENTSDWLDYYQAGIYAYKNNIDLDESYKYAEKALKEGQNEYTIALSLLYLEALGRDNEAQQLSALQEK